MGAESRKVAGTNPRSNVRTHVPNQGSTRSVCVIGDLMRPSAWFRTEMSLLEN